MKGIFFVMAACFLWALDSLIRYPLLYSGVPALKIVFYEHFFLLFFSLYVIILSPKKFWQSEVRHLFYFFVIGCLGSALSTLAFTHAIGLINLSIVILLQKLQPLVAIMLARVFLREPVQKKFLGWTSLCLIGGLLISYDIIFSNGMPEFSNVFNSKSFTGLALALIAVVGWGSSTVFGKKLTNDGFSDREIMAGRFIFGFAALLPLFIIKGSDFYLSSPSLAKLLVMVMLSGLASMYVYYHGLRLISARVCALAEMIFPFAAVVLNWVFLDAKLTVLQLIGGGLLLLASTVIQIKHY